MSKSVIIVGDRGQDGTLLKYSLEKQGIQVVGVSRGRLSMLNSSTVGSLSDAFSITDTSQVLALVELIQPNEIYYLAAHHVSSEQNGSDNSPYEYEEYHRVHVVGLLNFLWAISNHSPNCRFFYAASSLVFSGIHGPIQREDTPLTPTGFYGVTKAQGVLICRDFRQRKNIFASTGILYTHESIFRSKRFLSKKLICAAHRISMGLQHEVTIGDLNAQTDWGYALDYVDAFQRILKCNTSDDFIIATGESHSVAEFARIVFEYFGLDYLKYVVEDKHTLKRSVSRKVGDSTKLRESTGWAPTLDFSNMVRKLVTDYLANLKK